MPIVCPPSGTEAARQWLVGGDAGRMTSTPLEPESRWESELQRRGAAAVAAALASEGVGIGRGAEFRLFVHALANPRS